MDTPTPKPRKWDPVVRLTHWSIVIAILLNALVTEEGSGAHIWVGYGLAFILATRLIWGLVGPKASRFSAFPPSPTRAINHIKDIAALRTTAHNSHNPLGALMVYAIWGTLLVIIGTGIAMSGAPTLPQALGGPPAAVSSERTELRGEAGEHEEGEGAERRGGEGGEGGEGEEGPLTEVHEIAANLLCILILLHLAGVVFETRRSGRQIVVAMLP
jgi:cytochrome b